MGDPYNQPPALGFGGHTPLAFLATRYMCGMLLKKVYD
jgi:hypothetical protein